MEDKREDDATKSEVKSDTKSDAKKDKGKNPSVLVAVSGGIESLAALMLLQKQGFDCSAVCFSFLNTETIFAKMDSYQAEEEALAYSKNLQRVEKKKSVDWLRFLERNCHVKNLEEVKKLYDSCGVPFYVVDATADYWEYIVDQLLVRKLIGQEFNACVWCNHLKLEILNEKAKKLGIDKVATGHYAKVYYHHASDSYQIFSANDDRNDQSYLLSTLEQNHLDHLILPLGDLRREDVVKIVEGKLEKFPHLLERKSCGPCFQKDETLVRFIETYTHKSLRNEGNVIDRALDSILGDHRGVHSHYIGQKGMRYKGLKGVMQVDRKLEVVEIDSRGKIYVGTPEELMSVGVGLNRMKIQNCIEENLPISVCFRTEDKGEVHKGILIFKNNNHGVLHFIKSVYKLILGQHLALYDRTGPSGKVIGHGTVSYIGDMSFLELNDNKNSEEKDPHFIKKGEMGH